MDYPNNPMWYVYIYIEFTLRYYATSKYHLCKKWLLDFKRNVNNSVVDNRMNSCDTFYGTRGEIRFFSYVVKYLLRLDYGGLGLFLQNCYISVIYQWI